MHELIASLWGSRLQDTHRRLRNNEHVTNLQDAAYQRYCLLQRSYLAHELGIQDRAKDNHFVLDVARLLRSNVTHKEVVGKVGQRLSATITQVPSEYREEVVYFAARLLVMINVGRFMSEAHTRRNVPWGSSSLSACVQEHFAEAPKMSCEGGKLPRAFNAWTIETVGGIRVKFTDNLADHLLLVEDDSAVLLFHHASFLECQDTEYEERTSQMCLKPANCNSSSSILPGGLAGETLSTLALLFPQAEFSSARGCERTKRVWLKRLYEKSEKTNCIVDKRLIRCGNLNASERQVKNFKFWRDRLVVLKQAYDEATPSTLSQWRHDRRNGVQWYTFWVAVLVLTLTILFGLIQCIEGALQVYKAYHPTL